MTVSNFGSNRRRRHSALSENTHQAGKTREGGTFHWSGCRALFRDSRSTSLCARTRRVCPAASARCAVTLVTPATRQTRRASAADENTRTASSRTSAQRRARRSRQRTPTAPTASAQTHPPRPPSASATRRRLAWPSRPPFHSLRRSSPQPMRSTALLCPAANTIPPL